jgi:hypothetical protein
MYRAPGLAGRFGRTGLPALTKGEHDEEFEAEENRNEGVQIVQGAEAQACEDQEAEAVTHSSVLMRQQAEQRRWKREAEERERAARLIEPRPQQQPDQHSRRIAALEAQFEQMRLGYRQAQRQQAWATALDSLSAYLRPPQPKEPDIIVIDATAPSGPAFLDPNYFMWG